MRIIYTGAVMRGAVCGLDEGLSESYEGLVYKYSGKWVDKLSAQRIFAEDGEFNVSTLVVGRISSVDVLMKYSSPSDVFEQKPETYLLSADVRHDFGRQHVYLVFDKKDERLTSLAIVKQNEDIAIEVLSEGDIAALLGRR